MSNLIRIERDGAVLIATINRPEKKNALTGEMYEALNQALATASAEDGISVAMIAGAGGVFSAGNDINDFAMRAMAGGEGAASPGATFIRALARFEKPLVAAVDGLAVGIGTTLCFHCDLVYASPNALFKMPFVDLGIVPEAGSSYLAPRRFGYVALQNICCLPRVSAPKRRARSASSTRSFPPSSSSRSRWGRRARWR